MPGPLQQSPASGEMAIYKANSLILREVCLAALHLSTCGGGFKDLCEDED
jgi:hypothetical protein